MVVPGVHDTFSAAVSSEAGRMDCDELTSDVLLFWSRLIRASSLLDVDDQLVLCLIPVYGPRRVMHLIVDIKTRGVSTSPASEPGRTIRVLECHGSEEKPTFAKYWRSLPTTGLRTRGSEVLRSRAKARPVTLSSIIITRPQIFHVCVPAFPPASPVVVQTSYHPTGETHAMVAAETTSSRPLQAEERILDHPNRGRSRHHPIFHICAWDMAVETAQMENRPHR